MMDFLAFDSEHRLRAENLAFDIDVWYPLLAHFTFRTTFLPLRRKEAEAIRAFHDVSWRHCRDSLTSEEVKCLQRLEEDIKKELDFNFSNQPVMLRLCGRSPKDGDPLDAETLHKQYDLHLRQLLRGEGVMISADEAVKYEEVNAEMKIKAISKVSTLKVRNAQDAMSLLLTSERVYADMIDWLRFGEPEQIVLREWQDDLTMDNEFRLYVYKGAVTAISQYDHYGYYPHLESQREFLQSGLIELWRSIHAELGDETLSYVVDIGYLPSHDKFILIELSPFSPCTGAALFSWSRDKELLEGNRPMEFRLKRKEDVHPQLDEIIQLNWEERWRKELCPYWEWFDTAIDDSSSTTTGVAGWMGNVSKWLGVSQPAASSQPSEVPKHKLFVYGTLKRGFQWNTKYLSPRLGATFIGVVETCAAYPLVIGDCGVPYLLGDMPGEGQIIKGELWMVCDEALQGLDEYEGLSKGYYCRREIEVMSPSKNFNVVEKQLANVYMVQTSFKDLRDKPCVNEYTQNNSNYLAIQHILVKQVAYYKAPSTWGKTTDVISVVAPTT